MGLLGYGEVCMEKMGERLCAGRGRFEEKGKRIPCIAR